MGAESVSLRPSQGHAPGHAYGVIHPDCPPPARSRFVYIFRSSVYHTSLSFAIVDIPGAGRVFVWVSTFYDFLSQELLPPYNNLVQRLLYQECL